MAQVIYSVEKLKKLWSKGLTHMEIARELGCQPQYVAELRARHNLPARRRSYHSPQFTDPTPSEIEDRKREIRERHLEEKRREL